MDTLFTSWMLEQSFGCVLTLIGCSFISSRANTYSSCVHVCVFVYMRVTEVDICDVQGNVEGSQIFAILPQHLRHDAISLEIFHLACGCAICHFQSKHKLKSIVPRVCKLPVLRGCICLMYSLIEFKHYSRGLQMSSAVWIRLVIRFW